MTSNPGFQNQIFQRCRHGLAPTSRFLMTQVFLDFFSHTPLITVVFFNCHVFVEKKIGHVSVLNFTDGEAQYVSLMNTLI